MAKAPVPKKIVRIGVMGDSITAASYYVNELTRLARQFGLNYKFFAHGVSGNNTHQMLKRFDKDITRKKYDEVMILGGVNDIAGGKKAEWSYENLMAMCNKAKKAGMKVTLVTVLPWAGHRNWSRRKQAETEKLNGYIKDVFPLLIDDQRKGPLVDRVVDAYSALTKPRSKQIRVATNRNDHLHPTKPGHMELAKVIFDSAFKKTQPIIKETKTKAVALR